MILKNITKREKTIFLITFVVILIMLCYNFLIEPLTKKITFANNEIGVSQIELNKIQRLLLEREEILSFYEQYAKDVKIKGASDEEAIANFLSNVESLARKSSVLINDVKPKPTKDFDNYKKFSFDLEIDGSIDNITKFIYELESSSEAIKVERLQISVKTGKDDILKADLTISKLTMP